MLDAVWNALRLRPHRNEAGAGGLRHEQPGVASGHPTERTELVADYEYETRSDPHRGQRRQDPPRRVAFVGQPHLHMFGVGRDAGTGQAYLSGCSFRQGHDLGQTIGDAGVVEPLLHRLQQLADELLGRSRPFRLRDEVDLAAVQAIGHDRAAEALACESLGHHGGDVVQRALLRLSGEPPPAQFGLMWSDLVDLGSTIQTQPQPSGGEVVHVAPTTGLELTVDVGEVRATHDRHVHARLEQRLDSAA